MISKNKTRTHEKFLNIAKILAEESDVPRYFFGAILVTNKTIISSGGNGTKTHPLQYRLNQLREAGKRDRSFVHAEVNCLSKIKVIPDNAVLYIARVGKNGKNMMARPCNGCMSEIKFRGIKQIVYTTDSGFAVETLESDK